MSTGFGIRVEAHTGISYGHEIGFWMCAEYRNSVLNTIPLQCSQRLRYIKCSIHPAPLPTRLLLRKRIFSLAGVRAPATQDGDRQGNEAIAVATANHGRHLRKKSFVNTGPHL